MTEHRLGINPGFLTKHTLNLQGLTPDNRQQLVTELDELLWVDGVSLNEQKHSLTIRYDASHHSIDELIALVRQHGVILKDNWWQRIKLGWQRQTDENIQDNARHEPHCCNKMPRH